MSGLPVPTPYTAATGNFVTAALWNAQVRDAVSFLTDPPRFIGYSAVAQSFNSGSTYQTITLDSEILDTEGGHSTSTNTSRYTCQYAGLYQVNYSVSFGQNGTGNRSARIIVNGTTISNNPGNSIEGQASTGSFSWVGAGACHVYLNVGDYVELQAWQSSGAALSTNTNNTGLSLAWVAK
jgi:hypothetical protein